MMVEKNTVSENAISRFIRGHFSSNEMMFREALAFQMDVIQKMSAGDFLALMAEIVAAVSWSGGPQGPTAEEIQERAEKTAGILKRHGLGGIDAGKFFAAIVVLSKFLSRK